MAVSVAQDMLLRELSTLDPACIVDRRVHGKIAVVKALGATVRFPALDGADITKQLNKCDIQTEVQTEEAPDFESALRRVLEDATEELDLAQAGSKFADMHGKTMKEMLPPSLRGMKVTAALETLTEICTVRRVPHSNGSGKFSTFVSLRTGSGPSASPPKSQDPPSARKVAPPKNQDCAPQAAAAAPTPPSAGSEPEQQDPPSLRKVEPGAPNPTPSPTPKTATAQRSPLSKPSDAVSSALRNDMTKLTGKLVGLWEILNRGTEKEEAAGHSQAKGVESEIKAVQSAMGKLTDIEAVFPVYGATKAGKSTFLQCLLRQDVLPEGVLPSTSLPIKVIHRDGGGITLTMVQHQQYNAAVQGYCSKITSGALEAPDFSKLKTSDKYLMDVFEDIKARRFVQFQRTVTESEPAKQQLLWLSHVVRLFWLAGYDFETEHDVSVDADTLPLLEIDIAIFREMTNQRFSFLDTPGPDEAAAHDALKKIAPKTMTTASGCIFCVPFNQVANKNQRKLFQHLNHWMAGKKVIVIVTMMDSFTGGAAALESVKQTILDNFNPDVRSNVVIYPTSGHKLITLFELEYILQQKLSDKACMDMIFNDEKLMEGLRTHYKVDMWLDKLAPDQQVQTLRTELEKNLKDLHAEDIIGEFRGSYADADRIALVGVVQSLANSYQRWEDVLRNMEEYAKVGIEQRKRIQDDLREMQDVYKSALAEFDAMVEGVKSDVGDVVERTVVDAIQKWADEQDSWEVAFEMPTVEVCFVMDCTGSMGSYISAARDRIIAIADQIAKQFRNVEVQFSFIGYRDHKDTVQYEQHGFTTDMHKLKAFIGRLKATGGGDAPEDVAGGLQKALGLPWSASVRCCILVLDAPCHGKEFHSMSDDFPAGDPNGLDPLKQMQQFRQAGICFSLYCANNSTDQMCDKFAAAYKGSQDGVSYVMDRQMLSDAGAFEARAVASIKRSVVNGRASQTSGTVVHKTSKVCDAIPFFGGKSELLDWYEDTAVPDLINPFKDKVKSALQEAEVGIRNVIEARWKACHKMLNKIQALDLAEEAGHNFIEFKQQPKVDLDKDSLAETLCAFDPSKITYTEEASKVVLHNSTFKRDVLAEFQKQAHTVAEEVTEQVHAKLATPVQEFEAAVAAERNKVEAIYAQNQALLEASMSNEEVEAAIASAKEQRRSFEAELKQMQRRIGTITGGGGGAGAAAASG